MLLTPLSALPAAVYFRAAIALAVLAGFLGLYAYAANERAGASKARAETAQFRAAYDILAAKAAEQNAAILRMEADAEDSRQKAAKALEDAQKKNAPRRQAAAKLRTTRVQTCPDAVSAVRRALR